MVRRAAIFLAHLEAGVEAIDARLCESLVQRIQPLVRLFGHLSEAFELLGQRIYRLIQLVLGIGPVYTRWTLVNFGLTDARRQERTLLRFANIGERDL